MFVGFILFAVGILALWHFIIEAIIAPSARATGRLRLFALRDKLRTLRIEGTISEEEFEEAQRRMNNYIRYAPQVDAWWLVEWEIKIRQDKELAKRLERREIEFESSASADVKSLFEEASATAFKVIRFNSMGWIIYLVPLFIGALLVNRVKREIKNLSGATEHEFEDSQPCPV